METLSEKDKYWSYINQVFLIACFKSSFFCACKYHTKTNKKQKIIDKYKHLRYTINIARKQRDKGGKINA